MTANRFAVEYLPVDSDHPEFGTAATIPWDSDIFGFTVAEFAIADAAAVAATEAEFRHALAAWTSAHSVQLISCSLPAQCLIAMPALSRAGFSFIELALRASITDVQKRTTGYSSSLRLAQAKDFDAVQSMAATAFSAGRYSADPLVDPAAASQRWVVWIKNALSMADFGDRVLVMGNPGNPSCFFHLRVAGDSADLRLAGVRRDLQGGALGYRLYAAVLHWLNQHGVRRATARLSATNTPVLNLYSALGFSFSNPEVVLHSHLRP